MSEVKLKSGYYRVSVKALVFNETRDKFLVCQKDTGAWELPGGGLDWGALPHDELQRELQEEMSIKATYIEAKPSYFFTVHKENDLWVANVIYETELEHLNFVPSNECIAIEFVDVKMLADMDNVFPIVKELAKTLEILDRG